MKSIKPRRKPSGLGFISAVILIVFGFIYTVVGMVFPLYGIIFIVVGIIQVIYYFIEKKRFSIVDIVNLKEEGDPID